MTLDTLPAHRRARIVAVDWAALAPDEGKRLRSLGFDAGAGVTVEYRGILFWRDPLAISIGRMTVALRRAHARAMTVETL